MFLGFQTSPEMKAHEIRRPMYMCALLSRRRVADAFSCSLYGDLSPVGPFSSYLPGDA